MYLRLQHVLFDEASDGTGTGGTGDTGGIDIDATVDSFAKDLGLTDDKSSAAISSSEPGDVTDPAKSAAGEPTPEQKAETERLAKEAQDKKAAESSSQVTLRPAPKSWAADKHDVWGKAAAVPGLQEQIEHREKQMMDGLGRYQAGHEYATAMDKTIGPYREHLRASGVTNEVAAVGSLLAAHRALNDPDPIKRAQNFAKLAKEYKLPLESLTTNWGDEASYNDPKVAQLEARLNKADQEKADETTRQLETVKAKNAKEVEDFANDPAHPHFDECATDIALYCQAGYTLKDAYERAVNANPVTRAKADAAAKKAADEKLRTEAAANAEKARKARSANGGGRESTQRPADPLGSMEDTMHETLAAIKTRVG